MFDGIYNDQFPPGAAAYAAYVDGGVGDQPNYAFIEQAFPGARHLSITVFGNDADAADVENGAMNPADVPGWFARQVARGVQRPVVYASASAMEAEIVPLLGALPGARAAVRLWSAHYGAGEHICGPSTCRALSIDADGTQWTSSALGRVLDASLLVPDFFGNPPAPTWEEHLMSVIPVIRQGSTDVQAVKNWQGLLVARGYDLGTTGLRRDGVDGDWGDITQRATLAFQGAARIRQDGVVGPVTYTAALTS